MKLFTYGYICLALAVSLFYGFGAVSIFLGKEATKQLTPIKRIREIVFNFLGAIVGFLVLYFLIRKAMFCTLEQRYDYESIIDVLLLIIALMGISGYLPYVTYRLSDGIGKLVEKLLKIGEK